MTTQTGNPIKGVALVIVAAMLFALADVLTKHLTMLYAVPLVIFLRYVVNSVLLVAFLAPRHGRALWATQRTGMVVLRAACLAAASLTMGIALRYMPVGETVAIIYLAPILVMIAASRLLGEKVSTTGWIGAGVGFCGVLLIMRPGAGLDPIGVGFALLNALCATGYALLSRILARTETTVALLFNTAAVGSLVFGVMLIGTGIGPLPVGIDWVWLLALGALATVGHFLYTAAYREAAASLLAPVNYLHLVWTGILGWLVFDHAPDLISITGMAMVAGAGIAVALRTHFARAQPAVIT